MKIIAASIDLSKVDKSRIKTTAKGQKFYPITIMVNDEEDNFGNDVAIIEGMTKDERMSGVKKKIHREWKDHLRKIKNHFK